MLYKEAQVGCLQPLDPQSAMLPTSQKNYSPWLLLPHDSQIKQNIENRMIFLSKKKKKKGVCASKWLEESARASSKQLFGALYQQGSLPWAWVWRADEIRGHVSLLSTQQCFALQIKHPGKRVHISLSCLFSLETNWTTGAKRSAALWGFYNNKWVFVEPKYFSVWLSRWGITTQRTP